MPRHRGNPWDRHSPWRDRRRCGRQRSWGRFVVSIGGFAKLIGSPPPMESLARSPWCRRHLRSPRRRCRRRLWGRRRRFWSPPPRGRCGCDAPVWCDSLCSISDRMDAGLRIVSRFMQAARVLEPANFRLSGVMCCWELIRSQWPGLAAKVLSHERPVLSHERAIAYASGGFRPFSDRVAMSSVTPHPTRHSCG